MVKMVKTLDEVPVGWCYESSFQSGAVLRHNPLPEPTPWYVPPPVKHGVCTSTPDEMKYLIRNSLS